jgi:hypothetical protein
MISTQLPVPEHAPLQPSNTEPAEGVTISVTEVPCVNASEQSEPQLIPPGELEIVPDPVPLVVTAREKVGGGGGAGFAVNVAITDWALETTTEHPAVPVHAPAQPANVEPLEAVAVRVTLCP